VAGTCLSSDSFSQIPSHLYVELQTRETSRQEESSTLRVTLFMSLPCCSNKSLTT
jgi:hypothetical protein